MATIRIVIDSDTRDSVKKIARQNSVSVSYLVSEFLEQFVKDPDRWKHLH